MIAFGLSHLMSVNNGFWLLPILEPLTLSEICVIPMTQKPGRHLWVISSPRRLHIGVISLAGALGTTGDFHRLDPKMGG